MFDFIGQLPNYAATCFELYRYCRICAVDVQLQVAPEYTGTGRQNSFESVLAPLPNAEAIVPPPITLLRNIRGAKYKLSSALGQNRVNLIGHWKSFDQLGNPAYDKDTWQTLVTSAVTTIDDEHPVILAMVRTLGADTQPVAVSLRVTYHMQFFDLEIPGWDAQGLTNGVPKAVNFEEEEDDRSFVEPSLKSTKKYPLTPGQEVLELSKTKTVRVAKK